MRVPIALMLATLTDRRDFGEDWLLERKFDGERCVARKEGDAVRLESRTGKDLTGTYPEVRAALAAQRPDRFLLDGEVVAFDGAADVLQPSAAATGGHEAVSGAGRGVPGRLLRLRPSRSRLGRISPRGRWSSAAPGSSRRSGRRTACRSAKPGSDESERRFAEACRAGWEGLIAKRADAPYARGRSRDWLKLKCVLEQEFVIGGYTDPAGSRTDFGALLVGYYEGDRLRYAGKVGTGYSAERLTELGARLRKLETRESPFADARPIPRGTHWTRPELVAQIGFAEWTAEGRLRQPRFLGLRDDKRPADVVRERAS